MPLLRGFLTSRDKKKRGDVSQLAAKLLPQQEKNCSDVSQLAAKSLCPSGQDPLLAKIVFGQHASHIAFLLRDRSVLCLCVDQDRQEATFLRLLEVIQKIYVFSKVLEDNMSNGCLPNDGAPPSAFVWKDFRSKCDSVWSKPSNENQPLFDRNFDIMLDCMFKATEMFMQEAHHGVEIDPLWGNYFDDNLQKVIKWCECIRRQKWLFDDSCDESTLVETSGDSQPAVARPANPRQPLKQLAGGEVADKAEMLRYVVVEVPPCIVSTPGGQQLAKRMMTETWEYLTANDIDDVWRKPIPLSGLLRVERSLGEQPQPPRKCAKCGAATKSKCSKCLQVYYCSAICQHAHWSEHRLQCKVPQPAVDRHVAIAVPDFSCFWAYQKWLQKQTTKIEDPGIMIISRKAFKDMFGCENIQRTCSEMAFRGKPACLVISVFNAARRPLC